MSEEHELRKSQEEIFRIIEGGFNKDIAKLAKNVFDSFKNEGFNDEQSLRLTIALCFKK